MDESTDSNSSNNNSPPISRRKNLIPGVDDAHLALGGTALTLAALGIVAWPSIQDWISKTFKMPPPVPVSVSLPNGQPQQQPTVVPSPPTVLPAPQQPEPQNEQGRISYPYLQRGNISPVGQAVSVSAMETVPDELPLQAPQQQQKRQSQNQGYNSPFGASISGEVG